ncbi:MAG: copper-binding protein [Hyphomicrobiaceae bacterium]
MRTIIIAGLVGVVFAAGPALAQSSGHGGHADHAMSHTTTEVKAKAVIHKVDTHNGMVNVTHDPVPELKWPQMRMDLPVTKRVDLSKIKIGDKVTITLKQGVDKEYRVIEIEPAQ